MWIIKSERIDANCPYLNKLIPFGFKLGLVYCEETRNAIKFKSKWQAQNFAEILYVLGTLTPEIVKFEKVKEN